MLLSQILQNGPSEKYHNLDPTTSFFRTLFFGDKNFMVFKMWFCQGNPFITSCRSRSCWIILPSWRSWTCCQVLRRPEKKENDQLEMFGVYAILINFMFLQFYDILLNYHDFMILDVHVVLQDSKNIHSKSMECFRLHRPVAFQDPDKSFIASGEPLPDFSI